LENSQDQDIDKGDTMADHLAIAETEINASPARVWVALTDPQLIKRYMFGSHVVTDWHQGSTIVWEGEYEGHVYQDKGQILEIEPERRLKVSHFSPLSAQRDVPENYHVSSTSSRPMGTPRVFPSARTRTPAWMKPTGPRGTGR
jgi:hypothetical protein